MASDQGLHYLIRTTCPNSQGKYGIRCSLNPFIPEFLKWTPPSLNFDMSTDANWSFGLKSRTYDKQCRS